MQNCSPSPVPDDQCALKSEGVRIQDLSIQHSLAGASGSSSPPPPAPLAARRDEPSDGATAANASALRSSPLKRKNKRVSLSPSAKKKTSLSDVVVAEGELVVAEEHEQRGCGGAVVLRTLGSIFCVLVVKNGVALHLETISEHKHHLIDLDVAQTDLVRLESDDAEARKFKLRFRCCAQDRPSAYVFECATHTQCSKWVDAITGFHDVTSGRSQSGSDGDSRDASQSNSNSSHSVSCHARASAAQQSAASRRMRSIASLCGDLPRAQQLQQRLLPGPCSNFLYTAPPRTKHVLLVRHGHYINAHARGVPDSHQVLSQLGRQQAEFTGKYLEQLYARVPTRHDLSISHSDLTRAVETAQTVGKHFGHCALSATRLLREGWPGRPYSSHEPVPQVADAAAVDHAELARIDVERMELAFQTFFTQLGGGSGSGDVPSGASGTAADSDDIGGEEQLSYHVIVCHANLIRFFLCRAMGIEPTGRWGHFEINHCGVTRVDVCEHRPLKIVSVNETGHLPHSLITSSEDHL